MIHCSVPISQAETLLNTTYSTYQHEDGSQLNRAPEWSLPEYLHDHINVVQPTTSFFRLRRQAVQDESAWHDVSWWQAQAQETYPQAFAGSADGELGQQLDQQAGGPDQVQAGIGPDAAGPPLDPGSVQPPQVGSGSDIASLCQNGMLLLSKCKTKLMVA